MAAKTTRPHCWGSCLKQSFPSVIWGRAGRCTNHGKLHSFSRLFSRLFPFSNHPRPLVGTTEKCHLQRRPEVAQGQDTSWKFDSIVASYETDPRLCSDCFFGTQEPVWEPNAVLLFHMHSYESLEISSLPVPGLEERPLFEMSKS